MSANPCSASRIPWSVPQVVVDDGDPRIKYDKDWFNSVGVSSSTWGASLTGSTHRLKLTNSPSGFNFTFSGTSATVYGDTFSQTNNQGEITFELSTLCLVDGEQKGGIGSGPGALCAIDNLPDGQHTISYTVFSAANHSTLISYVDSIQYTPSRTEAGNETNLLLVDACDSSVDVKDDLKDWSAFNSTMAVTLSGLPLGYTNRYKGIKTNTHGAQLHLSFTGSRLEWMTTILSPNDNGTSATEAANATFVVDNSPDMTYNVQLPWYSNDTRYNQLVFQTPYLPISKHNVTVTYNGDPNSLPLSLSYFYVHNGQEAPPPASSHGSNHLGPILGGALGGVVGLILVLLSGWVMYHRRQRQMEKRAWDVVWQKRQPQPESLEMSPPKPEKS